jgi:uncharacterized protein
VEIQLLIANLTSPIVLAFALGVVAKLIRSDLDFPPALHASLSIFLLLAIGLKGGVALAAVPFSALIWPILAILFGALVTTFSAYALGRSFLKLSALDAGALAAHYGSVSAVTFIAAQQFAQREFGSVDGVLTALLVVLEAPALVLGVVLALGVRSHRELLEVGSETLRGRTMVLLGGGMAIGFISGSDGVRAVGPMFLELFQGVLMLFLLELGMLAAKHLSDLKRLGARLAVFAIVLPLAHGVLGVGLGVLVGFGEGGAAVMGAMLASASYIAAPAAVRLALPQANAGLCITAALGLSFPFNLGVGIPLYAKLAAWWI